MLRGYDDAGGLCFVSLSDEPSVASGYSSRPVHFDEVLSVGEHLSDNASLKPFLLVLDSDPCLYL